MHRIIAPVFAIAATAMLAAGCGDSGSVHSTSTRITQTQALAYADAVNLRAADVPGLQETRRPTKRETAAGPFDRQLDRCESAAARAGVVKGISSPLFVHVGSRSFQSVSSGVYFFTSAALAHQYLAVPDSARFAACVKAVVSDEPKTITREGSRVAEPMFSDPHVSTLRISWPGVRAYGLRLAAHSAFGAGRSESHEDFVSVVMGDAVVTLTTTSDPRSFPATTERRLLSLLYARAESHKLS